MHSSEIRSSFRAFFEGHGHRVLASSPLVPHGDPTLLFTNAGMVQFKDVFLGTSKPQASRVVTVQKCLRVSGKHNDLENVGPSPRHHTFFEMLGNFSFGDYFKDEAIRFAWGLVTDVWGLPDERLFATVYREDHEAETLWRKISTLPSERILRRGEKDNFWAMGETGPCGPCSEIFVDLEPGAPAVGFEQGSEDGRYLEIWNLVFMQFDRSAEGDLTPLPDPSIDTGAGLERLAAVLQGVRSNYDSDLFTPIIDATAAVAEMPCGKDTQADVSMRVVADHLRAIAFLLADGVVPSSDGRGYVLRRILRRAVRHGMSLGFEEPFLHRLVPIVVQEYGDEYPELGATQAASVATVESEESKFLDTVAVASQKVQELIDEVKAAGGDRLEGADVFRLYDTYGLPLEVMQEIAEEEQVSLDREGFDSELAGQRKRSRAAASSTKRLRQQVRSVLRALPDLAPTEFIGYQRLEQEVEVLALVLVSSDRVERADKLDVGETGALVVDSTPFYAESGGQVGDIGVFEAEGGDGRVTDTVAESGWILHMVTVDEGAVKAGDRVRLSVDSERRRATERNHTATHLLHAALRRVAGDSVRQAGSLVAPDRLRFDFTSPAALSAEQVREVEDFVNRWILTSGATLIEPGRSLEEALEAGAMALFGEKYGDTVRTVEVPPLSLGEGDVDKLTSLELCGGCHVRSLGEIGPFVVISERGVASGVRRVEALTGTAALSWQRDLRQTLEEVTARLGGIDIERVPAELDRLQAKRRELESELSRLRLKKLAEIDDDGVTDVEGIKVLAREVPPADIAELRNLADVLRSRLGSGVVLLGSRDQDKVSLLVAITGDLEGRLHAGGLAREVAELVGGKGGGRADFAQAGGREPAKLPAALAAVPDLVGRQLATGA